MRTFVLVLLTFAVPASASAPSKVLLEGYWYGESYQPSLRETTQELIDRRADGTFEIEFRLYKHCTLAFEEKEAGRWSLNGRIYHTDTLYVNGRAVDAKLPYYQDDYAIEKLEEGVFTSRHLKSGVRSTSRKVTRDFIFPACAI